MRDCCERIKRNKAKGVPSLEDYEDYLGKRVRKYDYEEDGSKYEKDELELEQY